MKNRLILTCVQFLRKFIPNNYTQNFLIVSTTGLGDSLWATPALQSLKTSFPASRITLLTTPTGEQVLRHNPWVDQTIVFKDPLLPHLFSLWKQLRREKIGTVLCLHASQRLALPLCSLIGATRIIGTFGINKGLDDLLTNSLHNSYQHEIVRRLEIVEIIGAARTTEALSYFPTQEELSSASTEPFIALHPGSKDTYKRWPIDHFVTVGRHLQQLGHNILITGTPEERPLMNQLAEQIPNAKLADSTLSLRSFAALLARASLLISNDTGPVHLAIALNTPVIALYSPTNPSLCGPHTAKNAIALAKPPTCTPCLKRKCKAPFCLLQIGPEEVLTHVSNTPV